MRREPTMPRTSGNTSLSGARIAVYARYSTDRQSDRSIEDQLARCTRYVEERGGRVDDALVFTDYAVSGQSLRRGWEDLMRAVDARRVDVIVAESVSRVSRDFADAATVFKRLEYLNVPLHGVGDGIDTSARGAKLSFGLKSLIDDHYIDALRDVTLRGMEQRARDGLSTGGLPYGYRSQPDPSGRGVVIEIHAGHADIVRRIFRAYADHMAYSEIARRLNTEGIAPPRASRKRRIEGWCATAIRSILHNAKYTGVWTFGERRWMKDPATRRRRPQARHPSDVVRLEREDLRIIDQALWDEVRARFDAPREPAAIAKPARARRSYMLSGLLRCGCCGGVMVIHGGDAERRYYGCAAARTRGTCTNRVAVKESLVRFCVVDEIRTKLATPRMVRDLREAVSKALGAGRRSFDAERRERSERLERIEARIRGLVTFIADGDRSEYVVSALRDLESQARSERAAIAELDRAAQAPIELPTREAIAARLDEVRDAIERSADEEPGRGREILRRLLEDGAIHLQPKEDGVHEARGAWLPMGLILGPEAETPPAKSRGGALYNAFCGGRI